MTDTPDKRPQREDYARSGVDIRQQRERLAAVSIKRKLPDPAVLARRRTMLRWAKWLLPATALLLLSAIAAWPEVEHLISANQTTMRELGKVKIESGNLIGATYRGVDEHGRPFTITADTVHQATGNRLDLSTPVADILTQAGNWLMVRSEKGVYMQHAQILDLTGEVTLYRDDGLMMHTPLADVDIRAGIITSDSWVRVEGPFGTLDAQGFLLSQHDGLAQFRGPGRLILNDDRQNDARTGKKAS